MNEKMQDKLVEIIGQIQHGVQAAGSFAMEQLPDIAQSYVVYGRAINTLYIALAVVLMLAAVWALVSGLKDAKRRSDAGLQYMHTNMPGVPGGDWVITRWVGAFVLAFPATMLMLVNLGECLLVWFAPKVWLLKELAYLVR